MNDTKDRGLVLVTGGGGYVGSALVPALLEAGYRVRCVDLFWYGKNVYGDAGSHPGLELLELDIRETARMREALAGVDHVIHLACISNDPSFELDPTLGRSINLDAFPGLLDGAVDAGVRRFLYASSSSIYGVKDTPDVREDAEPLPLTDYSRFKLECERLLLEHPNPRGMVRIIVRPATLCGWAPRLRLDLTVNILTIHALENRRIRIFGGKQLRPNLHIDDMVRAYLMFLEAPASEADGQAFNVGYQNHPVAELGEMVRDVVGAEEVELAFEPSDDHRSYHINSDKVRDRLGFEPAYTVADAVRSLVEAHAAGRIPGAMSDARYRNIERMKEVLGA